MNTIPARVVFFILISFSLGACINFKEVNHFSTTCQSGLDNDSTAEYGYFEYCRDSCYIYNESPKFLKEMDCHCSQAHGFDTTLTSEFRVLSAYFAALAKLSGSESVLSFAPIGSSIHEGTYGSMTVTQTESNVVNGLAAVATAVLTTNYKNSKIKDVIFKYNSSVVSAVKLLQLHTDNLRSKIDLMQQKLTEKSELYLHDASANAERWTLVYTYEKGYREYEKIKVVYDERYKMLDLIRKGHQQLFDNIQNLQEEGFKKSITILAKDIYGLSH